MIETGGPMKLDAKLIGIHNEIVNIKVPTTCVLCIVKGATTSNRLNASSRVETLTVPGTREILKKIKFQLSLEGSEQIEIISAISYMEEREIRLYDLLNVSDVKGITSNNEKEGNKNAQRETYF